jgi:menaquinone-dependent protoporphyrinogen oxidase
MRVLVTWSSKRGGTEGIGRALGDALHAHGFDVVAASARDVRAIDRFDAVIIGGALYANRWPLAVRRFVRRHLRELHKVPVWFFSSGPLDDSAESSSIPPTPQVADLAERVGAKGHVTFGGRLEPDAKGFPASAMARKHSGDWRNFDRIRVWASELAMQLPGARPGTPVEQPARSLSRPLAHAVGASSGFGRAWVVLTLVLAAHVVDEAVTDFIGTYNPIVRAARERFAWFPMPEYTFGPWLIGLCVLVILLLALSPFAYRGSRPLRIVAYLYAAIMLANGIAHLGASIYLGRWAPGATTAPLLIAASLWLFISLRRAREPK